MNTRFVLVAGQNVQGLYDTLTNLRACWLSVPARNRFCTFGSSRDGRGHQVERPDG